MKKIIIAFLPTLIIALGFIAYLEMDKKSGEEVILKVVTLDPYDLFRGNYVNLNYEIQNIDTDKITENFDSEELNYGEKVCVTLDDSIPSGQVELIKRSELEKFSEKKICGEYEYRNLNFTRKYLDLTDEEKQKINNEIYSYPEGEVVDYKKTEEKMKELGYKAEQYTLSFPSINKYFIPKGTGYAIDEAAREGRLTASINVTKAGNSYVNYLLIDGEKIDFSQIEARE